MALVVKELNGSLKWQVHYATCSGLLSRPQHVE